MTGQGDIALFPFDVRWSIDPTYIDRFPYDHPGMTIEGLADDLQSGRLEDQGAPYSVQRDVGIIGVTGPMTKYATAFGCKLGASTMVGIEAALMDAAGDESILGILLQVDSPGGMTAGLARVADAIECAMRIKPVIAYVSGACAGSAYAIAAEAHMIWADPAAMVGPIGVCQLAIDWYACIPGEPPAAEIFDPADDGGTEFIESVILGRIGKARNIPVAELRRLSSGPMIADEALANGLVDEVLPFDAAVDRLSRSDVSLIDQTLPFDTSFDRLSRGDFGLADRGIEG